MAATQPGTRAARALDDLYRVHVGDVYRYAYAVLGNQADAEDVTQTTFVNALRALERGERPRKAGNWLLVIAHNIIRQRFRQQQARPTEVELDREVADDRDEADDDVPTLEELMRALRRIPPSQREALVMRELEGRSYKEIAEILGLSTSALETLLFRARRSLVEEFENLVTCEKAELAMSRQLDGRLSRKERRRLDDHLAECPSCARVAERQRKYRHAFKGIALLPVPLSLMVFKGTPTATAAAALPVIGTGTAVTSGAIAGAGAGGAAGGGLLAGGLMAGTAAKVAAVVAAVTAAGGVGYQTVTQIQDHRRPSPPASAVRAATSHATSTSGGESSSRTRPGAEKSKSVPAAKARGKAKGAARAQSPPGKVRGTTAPGRARSATKKAQGATKHANRTKTPPAQKIEAPTGKSIGTSGTEGRPARADRKATQPADADAKRKVPAATRSNKKTDAKPPAKGRAKGYTPSAVTKETAEATRNGDGRGDRRRPAHRNGKK